MFQKTKYYPVNIDNKEIMDEPFKTQREMLFKYREGQIIPIKGDRLNKYKCYKAFRVQPLSA